ncbi:hypothetical protein [Citrobacter amalonaticus]|uniref:hypothetical protein n=1 Tax=Citrobacter amalonaticus TaxID=35703 RepID=UPI00300CEF80
MTTLLPVFHRFPSGTCLHGECHPDRDAALSKDHWHDGVRRCRMTAAPYPAYGGERRVSQAGQAKRPRQWFAG